MSIKRIIAFTILSMLFTVAVFAQQTGTGSYYNKKFQGRRTTSGERLDNELYTAAHRSLPLGTFVKVTNISNGKSVIVKVNDRGCYRRGRIIDVTYTAAKDLDMIRTGIIRVKVEVVSPSEEISILLDSLRFLEAPSVKPIETPSTPELPKSLPLKIK